MGLLKESLKVKGQREEAIHETADGAKCLMGTRHSILARGNRAFQREEKCKLSPEVNSSMLTCHILSFLFL